MIVKDVGNDWIAVTLFCRPPVNPYFKCWAVHRVGGVVLAAGDDPGWGRQGTFTHWLPASLRHTAFCEWRWEEAHKPLPPKIDTHQPVEPSLPLLEIQGV